MKNEPNPLLHMTLWGISSGFILSSLYIMLIANAPFLETLLNPVLWQLSVVFGALPGCFLGLLAGFNLWLNKRKIERPYSYGKIHQIRPEIYATTMALTIVATFMLIASIFSSMSLFYLLPPFIAGFVATYASHRYISRLIAWNNGLGSQHRKIHDETPDTSRLEGRTSDRLKNDVIIEERQSLKKEST